MMDKTCSSDPNWKDENLRKKLYQNIINFYQKDTKRPVKKLGKIENLIDLYLRLERNYEYRDKFQNLDSYQKIWKILKKMTSYDSNLLPDNLRLFLLKRIDENDVEDTLDDKENFDVKKFLNKTDKMYKNQHPFHHSS